MYRKETMASATSGWAGGSGLQYGGNVTQFNYAKQLATVIDALLNSTSYASRALYNAKDFNQATLIKVTKALARTQGQWISGSEPLNSSDEAVTILQQANRVLYSMPKVKLLTEEFARQYNVAVDYDAFQYQDIVDSMIQDLSAAIVSGTGTGNTPDSLDMICDDGTNYDVLNGVSRSTYTLQKGTLTNWSGTGSFSKLATMIDSVSDTGPNERPTVILTTFTAFSLFESLFMPTVRHEYQTLPVGGRYPVARKADGMGQGFETLDFRGTPIIKDKAVASGVGYVLNENYLDWYGDTKSPDTFDLKKISLGTDAKEGQSVDMRPTDFQGFFFQEERVLPTQAATIGRFFLSGQHVSWQPRRQGKFYGFTGV